MNYKRTQTQLKTQEHDSWTDENIYNEIKLQKKSKQKLQSKGYNNW
jgi:hypothetical protein